MKIQYIAVIFVLIIIPISLIMSQYIQTQIQTITLQTAYAKNLDSATHDAMKAFQINSINNKYSSVSNSKIRDIEASIQTFYTSLGTSMDAYISSKEQLSGFIPAVLFTLYDGYYIYSLYEDKYVATPVDPANPDDTQNVKVQIVDDGEYKDGLRPYIYYSAKYKVGNEIIVVNYTLDNEITVYGKLTDIDGAKRYLTKSGYLIDPGKVNAASIADDLSGAGDNRLIYDGLQIGPETLKEHLITFGEEDDAGNIGERIEQDYKYIIFNNQKVYQDVDGNGNIIRTSVQVPNYSATGELLGYITVDNVPRLFWYDEYKKKELQGEAVNVYKDYFGINLADLDTTDITKMEEFKSISAFKYYFEAYKFSNWVLSSELTQIKQSDLIKMEDTTTTIGTDTDYLSFNSAEKAIFDTSSSNTTGNDPMLSSSAFNNHREAIIRKSIETNLSTVIANYTKYNNLSTYDFRLPKIDEESWYQIANNTSIITFMQGIPIGMKYFNNYSVITSTKNEEVINSQTIYIVAEDNAGNREYHQPGCEKLITDVNTSGLITEELEAYGILSFQRQTAQVPDRDPNYFYPQSRITITDPIAYTGIKRKITGCYNCIVNATADYDVDGIIEGEIRHYERKDEVIHTESEIAEIKQIYLQALARERYDLYKSNFDLSD